MPTAGEAIIDKVRRFAPRDPAAARRLIPLAGKLTSSAPEGGFLGRPRIAAEFFLSELLDLADLSEPGTVLQEVLSTTDLRNVSVALRRMEQKESERSQTLTQDQHDLHELVVQELRGALEDKTQAHPSKLEGVVELLVHWAALTSGPEVRGWLHQVLDSSVWSTECFVALFVPLLTSARGQSFGDMDLTLVEELVGIDFLLEKLQPEVDYESFDWDSNDVSFERRKQRALAILSMEASKRAEEPGAPENS